jgi:hypothetical protein
VQAAMIFYATLDNPSGKPRSLRSIRQLVVAALALYPAGCLLRLLGPDTFVVQLTGLLMVVAAIACAALLAGSQLNRVTAEPTAKLDEYDRSLRQRAMVSAYPALAALVVLAIMYLGLASQFGWWTPRSWDHWNAVFWGAFLTTSLLPTAALAWQVDPGELDAGEVA